MTNDFHRTHVEQIDDPGLTAFCPLGCKEAPLSVANGSKITISYPLGLFPTMPSLGPHPEGFEDAEVNVAECFLGAHMPVVIGPAPDHRVERFYHLRCWAAKMGFDDLFGFSDNVFCLVL